MICTIDIGNTKKKYAIWQNNRCLKTGFVSDTWSEDMLECKTWVVSNVTNTTIDFPPNIKLWKISASVQLPFVLNYATPTTLGLDRISVVSGACAMGYTSAIIIDAGTCLKVELLINNVYVGGSISPGLNMRIKAMHAFTGKLPLINAKSFLNVIGNSTETCILSGAIKGSALEIEARIKEIHLEYGEIPILITGGDTQTLESCLNVKIFAAPNLLHTGLLYLHEIYTR